MKISKRWREKSKEYKRIAESLYLEAAIARNKTHKEPILECPYDFSEKAALELYVYESTGVGNLGIDIFNNKINGFVIGKKWLDVEISNKNKDGNVYKLLLYECL